MNDYKEPNSEVNVGEDIGHTNANIGEHLPTTNNDDEFTTTDFEGKPILQYTQKDVSLSTPCDEQKQLFLQGMEELMKKLDSMKIELETMNVDELEHKLKIVKRCITSLNEPYTFDRPYTISLPLRNFIYIIQKNVRRTRMGY